METFQTLTRFGLDKGIFIQDLNNYLEIVQNELEVFEGDTNEYHFYNYLSPVVGGNIPIRGYWEDLDNSDLIFKNAYLGTTVPGGIPEGEYNFNYVVVSGLNQKIKIPFLLKVLPA